MLEKHEKIDSSNTGKYERILLMTSCTLVIRIRIFEYDIFLEKRIWRSHIKA